MRTLELALVFAALLAVLWPVVFGVRPKRGIVAVALLGIAIAQLQLEGYRWQMVPVYLTVLGLAVGDVIFLDRDLRWSARLSRGVFGTGGIVVLSVLPLLLPVPVLPRPSGGLDVGTVDFELVDADREEIYGEAPGGSRRLMVQVWYPAVRGEGTEKAGWTNDWEVVAPAMSRRLGLPSWFLAHTRYTQGHALESAPVAPGVFPVVVYSHAWTGFRSVAVNQMESLASNGYIVIAPDHTHAAVATRFPDGEVVRFDPQALPREGEVGEDARMRAAATLIDTFAADVITILDELELGVGGRFANFATSVDLDRIGVFGHSAGGAAAVQVCLLDERCDAVLGLDPWIEPLPARVLREPATRPALFMRSDGWRGTNNDALLRGLAGRGRSVTYWIGVEGAGHNDFTAAPLLTSAGSRFGFTGTVPAGRMLSIVDNYLVGFFDVYLLGTGSAALDNVAFPNVSLERIGPSS